MTQGVGEPWPYNQYPYPWPSMPFYQVHTGPGPELRDYLAALALPAIYQHHTMLTDRAAELAYEQADEMLKARDRSNAASGNASETEFHKEK